MFPAWGKKFRTNSTSNIYSTIILRPFYLFFLGSSLTVSPACDMPKMTAEQGGKLVIVNMQNTPLDSKCHTRVYARCDDFMMRVMKHLSMKIPGNF